MSQMVSVERQINAPAEEIFALLADPARHADFDGSGMVQKLRGDGVPVAKALVSEPFGQRHAIYRDPNGVLIDVITPIPPTEEFLAQYAADAVPV